MAPGALLNMHDAARSPLAGATHPVERRYLLHRNVRTTPYCIIKSAGNILHLKNGWQVFDASGGAAVSCLGHSNERVKEAMMKQMDLGLSYICSMMFDTDVVHELSRFLIESTNGAMSRIVFYGSGSLPKPASSSAFLCAYANSQVGSESVEGAMKLALQYHKKEKVNPEPNRTIFIARNRSYHGATLGALSMSGHRARRTDFETVLTENAHHISPCNPYRDLKDGETLEEYVLRLKEELRNEFERVGPTNVAGFICEPVVGAALGCVPSVPGYLQAMKDVCHEYGALFILDEVMCGMGRCGYLHAWQEENVAPDIQLIGKGLAGGFQAISGMLVGKRIVEAFEHGPGNGAFNHGHTFQNHNIACAAALEVQKIVREQKLLENVKDKGKALFKKLNQRLADHPNVGNIRGKGLFLGIEFVQDKQSKEPFSPQEMVSWKIYEMGLRPPYGIHVYPGAGTVDGSRGDHVIISPAYNITDKDIDHIVAQVGLLVDDFFAKFSTAVPA